MPTPPPESPLGLIVDDNARNLKLAGDVLRAAGFRTLEAASGAEAIALADEHRRGQRRFPSSRWRRYCR